MIKIITALNNPEVNYELNKEKNIEIVGKNIFYKEGILEILEKEKNINYIIIDYNLPGEITTEEIINKIKKINKRIKIITLIKKQENKNIKNSKKLIYYEKIDLSKIKNLIFNNEKNNPIKNENKKEIINKDKKNELNNKTNNNKIINFIGNSKSGKTILIYLLTNILSNNGYKILIVEMDKYKRDLSELYYRNNHKNVDIILYEKINKKSDIDNKNKIDEKLLNKYDYIFIENLIINYKIIENKYLKLNNKKFNMYNILVVKPNLLDIKENINIINKNKIYNYKILINNYNKYSISEEIIKNIFKNKTIIKKINYNSEFEKIINDKINKKIEKKYKDLYRIFQK